VRLPLVWVRLPPPAPSYVHMRLIFEAYFGWQATGICRKEHPKRGFREKILK